MKFIISTIIVSFLLGVTSYAQTNERTGRGSQCPAELAGQQEQPQKMAPQQEQGKKKYPTREEIMSQKIAFFTQELELTPAEAQVFWPVYNQGWKKTHEAHKKVNKALKELNNALAAETSVSDKEIETLMEQYFSALKEESEIQEETYKAITQVLPLKKAAKTFTLEEKFRVMLIRQLRR